MLDKRHLLGIIALLGLVLVFTLFKKRDSEPILEEPKQYAKPKIAEPFSPIAPIVEEQEKQIYAQNIVEALSLSAASNKNILIIFGANWCEPCRNLHSIIKKEPIFIKYIILDIDYDTNREFARNYSVNGLPKCVVIDKNEHILDEESGFSNKARFIKWLTNVKTSKLGQIRI